MPGRGVRSWGEGRGDGGITSIYFLLPFFSLSFLGGPDLSRSSAFDAACLTWPLKRDLH